jgi:hypothetical protein
MYYVTIGNMFVTDFYYEDDTENVIICDVQCTCYSAAKYLFDSFQQADKVADLIGGSVNFDDYYTT